MNYQFVKISLVVPMVIRMSKNCKSRRLSKLEFTGFFLILAAILVCGSEGLNFEGLCFLELKKRLNHQFNQFV